MDLRKRSIAILAGGCLALAGCAGSHKPVTGVAEEPAESIAAPGGPARSAAPAPAEVGDAWDSPAEPAEPLPLPQAEVAAEDLEDVEEVAAEELEEPGEAGDFVGPVSDSPLDQLAIVEPAPSRAELEAERERATAGPPSFDIPMEINDKVLAWVDLYSGRMHDSFEASLGRSGSYLPMFREIFREQGLPQDLVYMAHVESGYKTSAYSRAHARGIFQFIAGTARRYGLRVDYWVDERADPERSARAAAAYMKDLYAEFGDWYLALAAYNAGEGKVRRAIDRTGSRDFWALARTAHLKRETKNHVPAILAATLMSKQPAKYGFSVERAAPLAYDTIAVEGAADLRVLARCAETDVETLRSLNPALRRMQTPPDGTIGVRVPPGSADRTTVALAAIPARERVLYERHRVKQGDTLSAIASRYGVGIAAIQSANSMGKSTLIRVNQVLLVPTSSGSRYSGADAVAVAAAEPESNAKRGEVVTHRVRRGDTLSSIARAYGTSAAAIASASGISVNKTLHVGDRLTVVRGVRDVALAANATGKGSDTAQRKPRVHTVSRGDTLWRIASAYQTSVSALCALNKISPSTILRPGTRLTVGLD